MDVDGSPAPESQSTGSSGRGTPQLSNPGTPRSLAGAGGSTADLRSLAGAGGSTADLRSLASAGGSTADLMSLSGEVRATPPPSGLSLSGNTAVVSPQVSTFCCFWNQQRSDEMGRHKFHPQKLPPPKKITPLLVLVQANFQLLRKIAGLVMKIAAPCAIFIEIV